VRDLGDGQHELRAGNLAPDDCLVINIQIAQLMQAQTNGYRYFLPTVIAPKYGQADQMNAVSHTHSILAHYPFLAHLHVQGGADVHCASHTLQDHDTGYQFRGALDQDIVLTVNSSQSKPYVIGTPHDDYPCLLSVLPPQQNIEPTCIANIVLLIDCSGSMTGLSIEQTKAGLSTLFTELAEGSEVSLMCFGSDVLNVTKKPLIINNKTRQALLSFTAELSADLGGTELWSALASAQKQAKKHEKTPDIILLTDGQVWDDATFFRTMTDEKLELCRINTIGVGSAVSDDIVIKLAEATKGQSMLVHPHEPMGERVNNFISRISAPQQPCFWEAPNTVWKSLPSSTSKLHGGVGYAVYEAGAPFNIALNDEALELTELTGNFALALQKIVGQQQLSTMDNDKATELSLKLGLVNSFTSFVMIKRQSVEGADGLPKLELVPQMTPSFKYQVRSSSVLDSQHVVFNDMECSSVPRFLRREASTTNVFEDSADLFDTNFSFIDSDSVRTILTKADKKLSRTFFKGKVPELSMLVKWGLNEEIAETIGAYFELGQVDEPDYYIAKLLLWLNEPEHILSNESIEILNEILAKASESDSTEIEAFVGMLEEEYVMV
jgi:uncharacterized protein YegL